MGTFERTYDQSTLRMFSSEQRAELQKQHELLDAKFDEIVSFISKAVGCSEQDAYDDAEQAVEQWELAELEAEPIEPSGPLQRLLREHQDIGDTLMNIRDDAILRNQPRGRR